jgi:hypothetical protein
MILFRGHDTQQPFCDELLGHIDCSKHDVLTQFVIKYNLLACQLLIGRLLITYNR